MRDPKRIEKVLGILRLYWEANPDLRLGQIVGNVARDVGLGPYYMEDDILVQVLQDALKGQ